MNYSFTNKNKRNKYKQFCENYSKFYFNFLIINNLFKIKNIILEKKIIYLILIKNSDLLQNKYNYKSYYKEAVLEAEKKLFKRIIFDIKILKI